MSRGEELQRGLYPFLYDGPEEGADPDGPATAALVEEVRQSTLRKAADVVALRRRVLEEFGPLIARAAQALAGAFGGGGKLLAIGNGGSATDAQDAAVDCLCPALPGWRALPALALTNDIGVVTAVGNDVGFDEVYARQVVAFGEPGDVLLAFTTSGSSRNIVAGLREANRRGLRTVALTGDEGGEIVAADLAEFCFVARTQHIPRVQEAHATIWHAMLELTHALLEDADAVSTVRGAPSEVGE